MTDEGRRRPRMNPWMPYTVTEYLHWLGFDYDAPEDRWVQTDHIARVHRVVSMDLIMMYPDVIGPLLEDYEDMGRWETHPHIPEGKGTDRWI